MKHHQTKRILSFLLFMPGVLSSLIAKIPEVELELSEQGWVILNNESRSHAFDKLAYAMSQSYPLTEWKGFSWEEAYDQLKPKVDAAVRLGDGTEYFRLIREFAMTANDGHVSVAAPEINAFPFQPSFEADGINASYGFAVARIADGSYSIVVEDKGSAANVGLVSGLEVISIDGVPVGEYVQHQTVEWTNMGTAHSEYRAYLKGVRAGIGRMGEVRRVEVYLVDSLLGYEFEIPAQRYQGPWFPGLASFFEPATQAISYSVSENGVGYLRLHAMITQDIVETRDEAAVEAFVAEVNREMTQALQVFQAEDVDQLVFDLRGNSGGLDRIGAEILGFFIEEAQLYTSLVPFDFESGDWIIDRVEIEMALPKASRFEGRIVVLADLLTVSAAEGLLDAMQKLPNCRFVGYWGSNGSFSETGGVAIMPGDVFVNWPLNPKIDADGQIRIDTTLDDKPTLSPDVRIPRNLAETMAVFQDSPDIVLQWAKLTLDDPLFGFFPGSFEDVQGLIHSPQFGIIKRWEKDPQVIFQKDLAWVRMIGRGGREQVFHRDDWGRCVTTPALFPVISSEKLGVGKVENGVFFPIPESEFE